MSCNLICTRYVLLCPFINRCTTSYVCLLQQVHVCDEFLKWLKQTYPFIRLNIVPAGCTSKVQIADVVVNRPFKARMKVNFMNHASNEVMEQMRAGVPSKDIVHDLSLSKLKPLVVDWVRDAFQHLKELGPVVREAYERTGMLKAWNEDTQVCDNVHVSIF